MHIRFEFDPTLRPCPVRPILIWAEKITIHDADATFAKVLQRTSTSARSSEQDDDRVARVRKMLRYGKYKPSGRSKPASEFLLRSALDGAGLTSILLPVDINNVISLDSALPASIFDADLLGHELLMRRGTQHESYVFNPSGQTIDVEDLLIVCGKPLIAGQRSDKLIPCGNPVKDSMMTKIHLKTNAVIAVVYAPADEPLASLTAIGAKYVSYLNDYAGAARADFFVPDLPTG